MSQLSDKDFFAGSSVYLTYFDSKRGWWGIVDRHDWLRLFCLESATCVFQVNLTPFLNDTDQPPLSFHPEYGGIILAKDHQLLLLGAHSGDCKPYLLGPWALWDCPEKYRIESFILHSETNLAMFMNWDRAFCIFDLESRSCLFYEQLSEYTSSFIVSRMGDTIAFLQHNKILLIETQRFERLEIEPPLIPTRLSKAKFTYDGSALLIIDHKKDYYLLKLETLELFPMSNRYDYGWFTGIECERGFLFRQTNGTMSWWNPKSNCHEETKNSPAVWYLAQILRTEHLMVWHADEAGLIALGRFFMATSRRDNRNLLEEQFCSSAQFNIPNNTSKEIDLSLDPLVARFRDDSDWKQREQLREFELFEERYPKVMSGWSASFFSPNLGEFRGAYNHETLDLNIVARPEQLNKYDHQMDQLASLEASSGPLVKAADLIPYEMLCLMEVCFHETFHVWQIFSQRITRTLNLDFRQLMSSRQLTIWSVLEAGLVWDLSSHRTLAAPLRSQGKAQELGSIAKYWILALERIPEAYQSYAGLTLMDLIEGQAYTFQKTHFQSWHIDTMPGSNPCYTRAFDLYRSKTDLPAEVFIVLVHIVLCEAYYPERRFNHPHPVALFRKMIEMVDSLAQKITKKDKFAQAANPPPTRQQFLLELMVELRKSLWPTSHCWFDPDEDWSKFDNEHKHMYCHLLQKVPRFISDEFLVTLLTQPSQFKSMMSAILTLDEIESTYFGQKMPRWEIVEISEVIDNISRIVLGNPPPRCCERHSYERTGSYPTLYTILNCEEEDSMCNRFRQIVGKELSSVIYPA